MESRGYRKGCWFSQHKENTDNYKKWECSQNHGGEILNFYEFWEVTNPHKKLGIFENTVALLPYDTEVEGFSFIVNVTSQESLILALEVQCFTIRARLAVPWISSKANIEREIKHKISVPVQRTHT